MTLISIREHGAQHAGPVIAIDGQEYAITLTDPFSAAEEQRLEWYFEQHLKFPFTDQVKAQDAARSIQTYGEALFNQLFADRRPYGRYQAALQQGIETLTFEIAGSPAFHRLHWEALKDPDLPQPLALQATFLRRNLTQQPIQATFRPSPTINLLIVTARPGGAHDVGYRTISRPLVTALRQANLRVNVEILRPGTYAELMHHLEAKQDAHGAGYYHVIHFDVHGALLTYAQFDQLEQALPLTAHTFQMRRYGRPHLPPYEGVKAFLFLEGPAAGLADPLAAAELAQLLIHHSIPIAILNACQSGKQIGASETSLGSQLMQGGLQMVLAMGYSVTVSAAELLMQQLYTALFAGSTLSAALRRARLELYNRKQRRAYFNQTIDLEDWLLPVVYQNQPQYLTTRDFTPEERIAFYTRQANPHADAAVTYQFVGRDLDILHIERALLMQRNILLIRGMGGAGKTTLLHHLAHWWQTTGFVDQVFYFGYDQRAYTRPQILDAIARQLLGDIAYRHEFQLLPGDDLKQAWLTERLRATRHLLILDNLESITGSALAIPNTLPAAEQTALHRFLSALAGGKTFVLLGSRSSETWLAPQTFGANVYDLGGLDPEAASALADLILERHHATHYRSAAAFQKLLQLLDGYPLALEVVLANLAHQSPAQVLAALQTGDLALDTGAAADDKTRNIVACIAYSHSNLSPEAQQLLLCLAPFTGVLDQRFLPQYAAHLQAQPALAHLPFAEWPAVLRAAQEWGLLTAHEVSGFLRLQPVLPYFLRTRLTQEPEAVQQALATAFRLHYAGLAQALFGLFEARDAQQRRLAQLLTQVEYENLAAALHLALAAQAPFSHLYAVLGLYLASVQDHRRGIELGQSIQAQMEHYPPAIRFGAAADGFLRVLGELGERQMTLQHYAEAEASYQAASQLIDQSQNVDAKQKAAWQATTYHQLGTVAYAQRQWAQAEQHYQLALALYSEFNDRYRQALTYHQLGTVAYEQRQWAQAEQHYQLALALYSEFNDRYSQASTYHQLGLVAQAQQQWAQAEQHYQLALTLFIEFNDRYEQAGTYHQLGNVAYEQRQWAQAEQHYQLALALFSEYNDRYAQAGTYHQLGIVAQAQRQWAQAEQHYQLALALKSEFNDRYRQALTYGQLGLLAEAQGQPAQAAAHLCQALALFHEFNDPHSMQITLDNLARLWQASGLTALPATVAGLLNTTPAEVETAFTQTLAQAEPPPDPPASPTTGGMHP